MKLRGQSEYSPLHEDERRWQGFGMISHPKHFDIICGTKLAARVGRVFCCPVTP